MIAGGGRKNNARCAVGARRAERPVFSTGPEKTKKHGYFSPGVFPECGTMLEKCREVEENAGNMRKVEANQSHRRKPTPAKNETMKK